MRTIDLSPLYKNSIGYDRLSSLLEGTLRSEQTTTGYPPYNIEAIDENQYSITLAVAGFSISDLDIQEQRGVLTIKGEKPDHNSNTKYLHRGIASRSFERKFNLADHVYVKEAKLSNGLLSIELKREIPEAMKPRKIDIKNIKDVLNPLDNDSKAA